MLRLGFLLGPFAPSHRTCPFSNFQRVYRATSNAERVFLFRTGRASLSMSGWARGSVVDVVEQRIRDALKPQSIRVEPTYGDPNGTHVSIRVVGDCFRGKRPVARHQLVYRAIWKEMDAGLIHAVDSLETLTPEEEGEGK
ncbi:hypothetical protein, conserved [Cyanidioschyzon merolae strain 10D]|uniref:BolA-like protein n=1 Tax=Cyanidioschyzon merolae (strain NIES-3377 / 10D) TaxID=280699 RepID=M1UNN9_CYAM1|nr:hypothetical protein, conserved [Cyanidioschyzon merolae strain 10D]BAM79021.1 hypothetical protein, conserved [Cyanidioschyzon merolae strain 10D]|eukprot:XP_005535307.1 hypothetical protein, conserved [Cyanidioschyzon merolae strain 10D]